MLGWRYTVWAMSANRSVVVFDLGGVLAEICHSWQEVAEFTGIACTRLDMSAKTGLLTFPGFDPFQASEISLDQYLADLSEFVGCDPTRALEVHNGILKRQYPGIRELINELLELSIPLGVISNTNQPHWEELAFADKFDAIRDCPMKMASHIVGINKPEVAIFHRYCETFGVTPDQVVYFDDAGFNVDAANSVGFSAYRIEPSGDTAAQIRVALTKENILPR